MLAFFSTEFPSHTFLVLVLLFTGLALTVVVAVYHLYRYNGVRILPGRFFWSENGSLKGVRDMVVSEKVLIGHDEVFDSETLRKIEKAASPKSLIFDRLQTIINLQRSYAKIDLDVLQSGTQMKEAANRTLEIPGYFVGFSMLVGLLGTIVGLSFMIGNMREALTLTQENLDFAAAAGNIKTVLNSMQYAFAATIGGLFCSIVSSLLNYSLQVTQARFYTRLDAFTAEELLPLVYRSREASDLLKDANENIEKTFSKLENISQDILSNTGRLNAVHESFDTIITNLEIMTRNPLRGEMQQVLQQLSSVISETIRTNQSIETTVEYIPRALEIMERNFQPGAGDIKGFSGADQASLENRGGRLPKYVPIDDKTFPAAAAAAQASRPYVPEKRGRQLFRLFFGSPLRVASVVVSGLTVIVLVIWILGA